jgi:hypothetical protein
MLRRRDFALVLVAAEADWKPESEQAATEILKKGREAAGKLKRFEVEYLECNRDTTFETEEQSRVRAYFEQSVGFILERHAIDSDSLKTSRRRADGQLYPVRSKSPETWLMIDELCTVVDESARTYEVLHVRPGQWMLGGLLNRLPHYAVPPWFDQSVLWSELKTRFVIERAQSTATEFSIDFAPRAENPGARTGWQLDWGLAWPMADDHLSGHQTVVIDRKTLLPKRWSISTLRRIGEQSFIYTRFDIRPPRREFKLALAGYQDLSLTSPYIETGELDSLAKEPEPKSDLSALELGARILWCLLF